MINNGKKIAMLVRGIFYPDGSNLVFGGVERYTVDLCNLLQNLNYKVDVFQGASEEWKKEYKGINFYGILDGKWHYNTAPTLNENFHNRIKDQYDFIIYNGCNLNYPYSAPNSLSIHHGIWWDCFDTSGLGWITNRNVSHVDMEFYRHMEYCLNNVKTIVSVDTNAINWTRAVFPHINMKKFHYIPNYVDLKKFYPTNIKNNEINVNKKKTNKRKNKNEENLENCKNDKKMFTVLFPRRLETARGWDITLDVAKKITSKYSNICFSFVGRQTKSREALMEKISKENNQINYSWKDMDAMPEVYQNADIVVIPSLWSEGTSLSCLEAMACGKPVVAGLVGGLTDLIINNFNGILIQADRDSELEKTIIDLYNNKEKCEILSQNALQTVKYFSKEQWENQWVSIIKENFI